MSEKMEAEERIKYERKKFLKQLLKYERKKFLKQLFWSRISKAVYIFLILVGVDQYLVYQANKNILERNADFDELLNTVDLNFDPINSRAYGKRRCFFRYEYHIYGYQVCFKPINTAKDPIEERGYYFIYSPPRPKLTLFFRGDSPDNYYFEMGTALGKRLKLIRSNGTVKNLEEVE